MEEKTMKGGMLQLSCNLLTLSQTDRQQDATKDTEIILHILAGKGMLVVGPEGGQQWSYPLDAYDTVWIPTDVEFVLKNDGIGNLEFSRYCYKA